MEIPRNAVKMQLRAIFFLISILEEVPRRDCSAKVKSNDVTNELGIADWLSWEVRAMVPCQTTICLTAYSVYYTLEMHWPTLYMEQSESTKGVPVLPEL